MIGWSVLVLVGILPFVVTQPKGDDKPQAISHEGQLVIDGIASGSQVVRKEQSEPAQPVFLGYPHGPKTSEFVPEGATRKTTIYTISTTGAFECRIHSSADSFACNSRRDAVLGTTFGSPDCGLFNAVYDRAADRLITLEGSDLALTHTKTSYQVRARGSVSITVKHHYVRDHLGYFFWSPVRPVWRDPVAGWCSWMAHLQNVSEKDVREATDFFASNLKEYGYDIIQIDDGFQRASQSGEPPLKPGERFFEQWTKPNSRFSSGLESLAHDISARGMTPGIWVGLFMPLGIKNSDGYVLDANGEPHRGPWVNYAVNALIPKALDEAYLQTLRELRRQGWKYFKIDTLRHVLYDSYRMAPEYWKRRNESPEKAFRTLFDGVKRTTGKQYTLACWGTIPELAGLPDGCRIGEDVGPDFASMRRSAKYIAQFQHLNNVVWRNDPDYMCLRLPLEQARAWTTLTALAGGHLMVSDPVGKYDAPRVDMLRRVGPPVFTHPQNIAPLPPDPELMVMAAEKGGEHWTVAARFGWGATVARAVPAEQLGIDPKLPYLAFDFWRSEFRGVIRGVVPFDALEEGHCQAVSLRAALDRPQVLGTDRHISQGAYELDGVTWSGATLAGLFKRGAGRRWSLFVHVPSGWKVQSVSPSSAASEMNNAVLRVTFAEGSPAARWKVKLSKITIQG